jgi:hypothetical protein
MLDYNPQLQRNNSKLRFDESSRISLAGLSVLFSDQFSEGGTGCPEVIRGRTLIRALKCKGLPSKFKESLAIAGDSSEWRSRTYSKPMPPSED